MPTNSEVFSSTHRQQNDNSSARPDLTYLRDTAFIYVPDRSINYESLTNDQLLKYERKERRIIIKVAAQITLREARKLGRNPSSDEFNSAYNIEIQNYDFPAIDEMTRREMQKQMTHNAIKF